MSRIIAIVTVYFPSFKHIDNIKKIINQCDELVVCDNSPYGNDSLFEEMNLNYIPNKSNLGLSAAFNKILTSDLIKFKKDDFIIFFDQDSEIPFNHIHRLIDEFIKLEENGINVGCLGPVYINKFTNTPQIPKKKQYINETSFSTSAIITSSMLCRYKTLDEVHFWNELFFLDLADFDLCWRMKKKGKLCVQTTVSHFYHSVGSAEKRFLFFRIRVGKPFREYYQTRESLVLLKLKYVPVSYKLRTLLRLMIRPVVHILFLGNKIDRVKYIILGYKDYKENKHGELTV